MACERVVGPYISEVDALLIRKGLASKKRKHKRMPFWLSAKEWNEQVYCWEAHGRFQSPWSSPKATSLLCSSDKKQERDPPYKHCITRYIKWYFTTDCTVCCQLMQEGLAGILLRCKKSIQICILDQEETTTAESNKINHVLGLRRISFLVVVLQLSWDLGTKASKSGSSEVKLPLKVQKTEMMQSSPTGLEHCSRRNHLTWQPNKNVNPLEAHQVFAIKYLLPHLARLQQVSHFRRLHSVHWYRQYRLDSVDTSTSMSTYFMVNQWQKTTMKNK